MNNLDFFNAAKNSSEKQFPQLERLFACWATPSDYVSLPKFLAERHLKYFGNRLEKSNLFQYLIDQPKLRHFDRKDISPDVTLYTSGDTHKTLSQRTILVCFAASGGRLTLPIAAFLQSIPDMSWDILLLRDQSQNHYRQGCFGLAQNFLTLCHAISAISREYGRVISLGTSMGGAPAIRFGLIHNTVLSVSIGGRRWNDISRIAETNLETPPFDNICACLLPADRSMIYVYSASHQKDKDEAHAMVALTGGVTMPISSATTHHVLGELWINNKLPMFLNAVLDV